MDPRQQSEEEQFMMNMIAKGGGPDGYVDEQADDGSNTDIYLNMSGDGLESSYREDNAAADQEANVYIITALLVFQSYLH